jgi:hypothetical protein
VSAHYFPEETVFDRERTVTRNLDSYRFLFGPRFILRFSDRLTPFGQPLVGVVRSKQDRFGTAGGEPFSETISQTGLAVAVGGGLDVSVGHRLAIRIIQTDYLWDRFTDSLWSRLGFASPLCLRRD